MYFLSLVLLSICMQSQTYDVHTAELLLFVLGVWIICNIITTVINSQLPISGIAFGLGVFISSDKYLSTNIFYND